jgi:hypothetical protein
MLYISVLATVSLKALPSFSSICENATKEMRRKRDANIQHPLAADGIVLAFLTTPSYQAGQPVAPIPETAPVVISLVLVGYWSRQMNGQVEWRGLTESVSIPVPLVLGVSPWCWS